MQRRIAKGIVISVIVIWGLLGFLGAVGAALSVMLFDAPGSENQIGTKILFVGAVSFPITCAASVILTAAALWDDLLGRACLWLSLPLVSFAIVFSGQAWIDHYQHGQFSGYKAAGSQS